jgi:hypothetical protein
MVNFLPETHPKMTDNPLFSKSLFKSEWGLVWAPEKRGDYRVNLTLCHPALIRPWANTKRYIKGTYLGGFKYNIY